jgi:threonine-phosphate decarboxylase
MITPKEHFHGSDLEKIEAVYGIKKEDITSFSANVNPLGISPKLRTSLTEQIDAITGYPDREYTSLRGSIANYIKADKKHVLVGNGSTELISILVQLTAPKKAMIISPTYSEYEREISLAGGSCSYYSLTESSLFQLDTKEFLNELTEDYDLLVICNPNNPTSSYIPSQDLDKIFTACKAKGIFCMVDETYVEFAEDMETITAIPLIEKHKNVVIFRGISKFFAAPGLRLGYAVCSDENLITAINARKNPWTINTLAAIAGEIMFTDTDYIMATKELMRTERNRICKLLSDCSNVKVYPPAANFVLVKILKDGITAADIFDTAIRQGLMIRDCSTFPGLDERYFRFCFMSPEKNTELLNLLWELLQ